MVRIHQSAAQYDRLGRFDEILQSRYEVIGNMYTLPLFFYRDYFMHKLVNKLMRHGKKAVSYRVLWCTLQRIKYVFGFQPFFIFKHIVFGMRQLFKISKTVIRNRRVIYSPIVLKPHNQVTYGINHVIASAVQLVSDERIKMPAALCIVLSSCFLESAVIASSDVDAEAEAEADAHIAQA
jgi:ribosomal protein S7